MTIHRWVWLGGSSASHISPPLLATSPLDRPLWFTSLPPFLPSHFGGHFAEADAFRVQWAPASRTTSMMLVHPNYRIQGQGFTVEISLVVSHFLPKPLLTDRVPVRRSSFASSRFGGRERRKQDPKWSRQKMGPESRLEINKLILTN